MGYTTTGTGATGNATDATLATRVSETNFSTMTGSIVEAAPATDTALSGLNGRLQRLAQRITSLIAQLPAALVGGRLDVNIGASPTTVPVSGTFFQTTQPVSLATAPTTPVTGTFWQSTQPVSGAFYQSTQPVSIATMPSTPVTGTFWQSTQPVSIASMPSTPVTGTFFQSTQPVSATALPLPTNAAIEAGGNLATLAAKDFSTGAKQDTAQTSLTSIDSKLTSPISTVAKGLVSDSLPDSTVEGTVQALSLTKLGRLRVATTPEDTGPNFFLEEYKSPWGTSLFPHSTPWELS